MDTGVVAIDYRHGSPYRRCRAVVALFAVLCCSNLALPQETPPGWKLYGFAKTSDVEQDLFYAAATLKRLPNGHIEVWTKGLKESEVQAKRDKPEKDQVSRTTEQLLRGYRPPLSRVRKLDEVMRLNVMASEDIANESDLQPVARILYELDCAAQRIRTLSIYIEVNEDKPQFQGKEGPWQRVGPETNASALSTLVCSK